MADGDACWLEATCSTHAHSVQDTRCIQRCAPCVTGSCQRPKASCGCGRARCSARTPASTSRKRSRTSSVQRSPVTRSSSVHCRAGCARSHPDAARRGVVPKASPRGLRTGRFARSGRASIVRGRSRASRTRSRPPGSTKTAATEIDEGRRGRDAQLPFFMSGLQPWAPHVAGASRFGDGVAAGKGRSRPASTTAVSAADGRTSGAAGAAAFVAVSASFGRDSSTARADSDLLQPTEAKVVERTASAAKSRS